MKRRFAFLLVCLLLVTAAVPAAAAGYAPCTAFTGYINGYRINVRTGPGTSNAVCGIAMCGDTFYVTNQAYCTGGRLWYYGTIGTLCGWIYSGYVCGAPVPVMAAVTTCPVTCNVAYILLDATNFRSGPGTSYTSIMQLNRGTALQISGAVRDAFGSVWYQAQVSGLTGWVRSDLVSSSAVGVVGVVPGTYPAGWSGIPASGYNGWTNTCAVNVRLAPNGTKIAQLSRGTPVMVTGVVCSCGVYWYRICYYGTTAYIRADLVNTTYPGFGTCGYPSAGAVVGGVGAAAPGAYGVYGVVGTYGVGGAAVVPDTAGAYAAPDAGNYGAAAVPDTGSYGAAPDTGSYGAAIVPDASASGAVQGVSEAPAAAAGTGHPRLSFTTFSFTPGQTLPVYAAPNASAPRSDGGTALMTVSGQVWVAGYDGQWLLVMYQNDSRMTRVGYVNAFQLQGTLPDIPSLSLNGTPAVIISRSALTSDPMEGTDTLMMLDSGSSVTWLADLDMNSAWAYVEVYANGTAVRGFVPRTALR